MTNSSNTNQQTAIVPYVKNHGLPTYQQLLKLVWTGTTNTARQQLLKELDDVINDDTDHCFTGKFDHTTRSPPYTFVFDSDGSMHVAPGYLTDKERDEQFWRGMDAHVAEMIRLIKEVDACVSPVPCDTN